MTAHLTLESKDGTLLQLVADFARGLGLQAEEPSAGDGRSIRIAMPESSQLLLELLTHVGLCAARANVDVTEPVCRVTTRHANASAEVRLGLRIAEFALASAPPPAS